MKELRVGKAKRAVDLEKRKMYYAEKGKFSQ
jgi:hypothetical protein